MKKQTVMRIPLNALRMITNIYRVIARVGASRRDVGAPVGPKVICILAFTISFMIFPVSVTGGFLLSTASTSVTLSAMPSFSGPAPVGLADHVVISEVQITEGAGKTAHDFIELYNPLTTSFDMKGYRLVKRTKTATADTTVKSWTGTAVIPAHGFYLWASNSDNSFPAGIGADASTSATLADDNSIALRLGAENSGTVIDAVAWGATGSATLLEGAAFLPNPGAGQSLERKAQSSSTAVSMNVGGPDELKGNGYDLENNAVDFILRAVSQPQNTSSPAEMIN